MPIGEVIDRAENQTGCLAVVGRPFGTEKAPSSYSKAAQKTENEFSTFHGNGIASSRKEKVFEQGFQTYKHQYATSKERHTNLTGTKNPVFGTEKQTGQREDKNREAHNQ